MEGKPGPAEEGEEEEAGGREGMTAESSSIEEREREGGKGKGREKRSGQRRSRERRWTSEFVRCSLSLSRRRREEQGEELKGWIWAYLLVLGNLWKGGRRKWKERRSR